MTSLQTLSAVIAETLARINHQRTNAAWLGS